MHHLIELFSDESGSATVDWFVFGFGAVSFALALVAAVAASAGGTELLAGLPSVY